jgi:hypothetical protein
MRDIGNNPAEWRRRAGETTAHCHVESPHCFTLNRVAKLPSGRYVLAAGFWKCVGAGDQEGHAAVKIGLIQSRGMGDIIVALPIAKYYVDRGNEVYWPINEGLMPSFVNAAPYVHWLPVPLKDDWVYAVPLDMLKRAGCERIFLTDLCVERPHLTNIAFALFLKFDEYKYAVAGVPFREKWNLSIVRDAAREQALFDRVVKTKDFIVAHLQGSNMTATFRLSSFASELVKDCQSIEITPLTDNIFDWLLVIERAALRITLDSCFANLIEQLKIPGRKLFIPRSIAHHTPVLQGDWAYLLPPVKRDSPVDQETSKGMPKIVQPRVQ